MLSGLLVLIVEDDPMIAMLISDDVAAANGSVVGPFPTVAEALEALQHATVGAAIVDANLADRDVTPLALTLRSTDVPFVIYTGTGLPDELAAQHPDLPVVLKPGRPVERLSAILTRSAPRIA